MVLTEHTRCSCVHSWYTGTCIKHFSAPREPSLYTNSCHAWEMSVLAHSAGFALERRELFPPKSVRTAKTPISQRHMLCRLLAVRPFENKTHSSRMHPIPMAGSLIPNLLSRLERKTHPHPYSERLGSIAGLMCFEKFVLDRLKIIYVHHLSYKSLIT